MHGPSLSVLMVFVNVARWKNGRYLLQWSGVHASTYVEVTVPIVRVDCIEHSTHSMKKTTNALNSERHCTQWVCKDIDVGDPIARHDISIGIPVIITLGKPGIRS